MARFIFGRRLKELRREAGVSQYELAKRTGLSKQAISYLESGDKEPGWTTVRLLARALGVSCEAFDVGEPEPPERSKPKKPRREKGGER